MADGMVHIEGACFGAPPVELPSSQVLLLLGRGDLLCNEASASGQHAGVVFTAAGALRLLQPGRFRVVRTDRAGGRETLRAAQFFCGIVGLLIVNVILLMDAAERMANVKDFLINFSSDILAMATVLFVSEIVDRQRGKSLYATPSTELELRQREGVHVGESDGSETNLYDAPFRSVR
jgi:hypothetical protein